MTPKLTIEDRLHIDKLYASGIHTDIIAEKYNVHPATILVYVSKNSRSNRAKSKERKHATDEDVVRMKELFSMGLDCKEISKLLDFTTSTIMRNIITKEYDIKENVDRATKLDFKQLILPEHPILRNAPTHIDMCRPTTDEKAFDYMINKF